MKEDSDFLKNNILACVDSYYECLFTWCTVYIRKVFLLQRLLSTTVVLSYSHSSPVPLTDVQCSVSMLNLQCNMSALYGFETKGWVKHSETSYLKKEESAFYILLQVLIFINLINCIMLLHVFKYVLNNAWGGCVFLLIIV